jgi:hypothetical protein
MTPPSRETTRRNHRRCGTCRGLAAALRRGKKRAEELKEILSPTLVRDAATRKRLWLSTLGVSFFDISDRSESRSLTGLVGGSSWPSAGDRTA